VVKRQASLAARSWQIGKPVALEPNAEDRDTPGVHFDTNHAPVSGVQTAHCTFEPPSLRADLAQHGEFEWLRNELAYSLSSASGAGATVIESPVVYTHRGSMFSIEQTRMIALSRVAHHLHSNIVFPAKQAFRRSDFAHLATRPSPSGQ